MSRPRGESRSVHGAVLLFPDGAAHSLRRRSPTAASAVAPLARRLARAGSDESLVSHVVHYRFHGWNGDAAHPAHDAQWAVEEVVRRYGDVPVCLLGTGMGARAALRAAGHPTVTAVMALSCRLPGLAATDEEPVSQLAERQVLFVHGTDDARGAPELSFRLAERAKKANPEVCRFEVHTDGHTLQRHRREVSALAEDFVLGTLCFRDFSRPLRDAMAAPGPLGLRMPLAAGFGRTPPRR